MNIKKIVILTIIFLLCILSIFVVIAITNYFYIKKQESIQFADLEECKREWLRTQQPLKRHDIYIMSKDEIPQYMKLYNIDVKFVSNTPSYNMYDYNMMNWYLKDPEPGLLGVYFTSRPNPFKSTYPNSDYKYTLNDLLKYELEISDAYIFWNANIKDDLNTTIYHHTIHIYNHQNNDTYKKESIQKDLFDNNITNNKIRVNLNCYNLTSTAGLSASFNSNESNFYGYKIEAVYFDDGYRLEYPDISINNLIRLGNGAKNIHLYSFVIKEKTKIDVPDTFENPYTAIIEWKKQKGLFNNPQVIAKSDYTWEIKGDTFILTHIVETEDKIYHIKFASNYNEKLQKWKDQCYIKLLHPYSPGEIRDKFGRTSKIIYDEYGKEINYKYEKGFLIDDWYIDGISIYSTDYIFGRYLDTTKPPKIPIENDNTTSKAKIPFEDLMERDYRERTLKKRLYELNKYNEQTLIVKQQEINDEKIVRPQSENFKVKKINKTVKIHKKL